MSLQGKSIIVIILAALVLSVIAVSISYSVYSNTMAEYFNPQY